VAAPSAPASAVAAAAHRDHREKHKKEAKPPAATPKPATSSSTPALAPAPAAPAPRTFATVYAEADGLFKNGDVNSAVAKYGEAAKLNPSDARTQRQLGKCWLRLGQRDRAAPYLRRYLELAPDASDAPFIRANLEEK
jgi:Flp pilus assembly protein TadD